MPVVRTMFFLLSFAGVLSFPFACYSQSKHLTLLQAVKTALDKQTDIELAALDIEYAQAKLQENSGKFDLTFHTGTSLGQTSTPLDAADRSVTGEEKKIQTDASYSLGLSKTFRTGINISPVLQTGWKKVDISPYQALSTTEAYLSATLPLLRGRGRMAAAGLEMAAEQDVSAAEFQFQETVNSVVHDTVQAYWKYLLDYSLLKLQLSAEKQARELLKQTSLLVEHDELPAAEIDQVRAHLFQKKTQRIQAEQALRQSRLDLGLAMGLSWDSISGLSLPAEDIKGILPDPSMVKNINDSALMDYAAVKRPDLASSRIQEKAAGIRKKALQNELLPRVDLGLKVGYHGLKEDNSLDSMLQSPASNVPGLSGQVSLSLELPLKNRQARGRYNQQSIVQRRQVMHTRELERTIRSNIQTQVSLLQGNIEQLKEASLTVDYFVQAQKNEFLKFTMGMSTQTDLIDIRDKLTQARQDLVRAGYRCLTTVTGLRYKTATITEFSDKEVKVDMQSLAGVPLL